MYIWPTYVLANTRYRTLLANLGLISRVATVGHHLVTMRQNLPKGRDLTRQEAFCAPIVVDTAAAFGQYCCASVQYYWHSTE